MRTSWVLLVGGGFTLACRATAPSNAPAPSSTAPAEPLVRTVVSVGETFRPASGDSALRAFRPGLLPTTAGGECRVLRTSGSGATMVTAAFPAFDSLKTSVTLFFDSAGHLVRYSEFTSERVRPRLPPATAAQRDSAMRADQEIRRSGVSLDYAIDQAVATNSGGRRPTAAVIGTVRQMESLDALGPPTKRLAMVRKLCGV